MVKTIVLCGGKGTRAYPQTVDVPKPLLEVAGRPVLLHLMEIYAGQGYDDFVLAGGYKVGLLQEFATTLPSEWTVDVVDTGEETNTGGRVKRCLDRVGERFFVTYADGLGDVDLRSLQGFHEAHEGTATLTTVPLPSQYGTLEVSEVGKVLRFREKPVLQDHTINAGFFVFDQRAFARPLGEDLERDILPTLGAAEELFAYRHDGFWKSMDTYKDALELSALCQTGTPPWFGRHPRSTDATTLPGNDA